MGLLVQNISDSLFHFYLFIYFEALNLYCVTLTLKIAIRTLTLKIAIRTFTMTLWLNKWIMSVWFIRGSLSCIIIPSLAWKASSVQKIWSEHNSDIRTLAQTDRWARWRQCSLPLPAFRGKEYGWVGNTLNAQRQRDPSEEASRVSIDRAGNELRSTLTPLSRSI